MSHNPNQGEQDQTQTMIAGVAVILGIILVVYFMQEQISAFAGAVSYLHIYPFALLLEYIPQLRDLPFVGNMFFGKVEYVKLFLDQGNFAYMNAEQRRMVLTAAGLCAIPFYVPFMIYVGLMGRNFRPDMTYRNNYSLDRMIHTQSEHWLTSRNARHVNPLKKSEVSAGFLVRRIVESSTGSKTGNRDVGEMVRIVPPVIAPENWHRSMRPEEWLVANGLCLDQEEIDKAIAKKWKYPDGLLESRNTWLELKLPTLMEVCSRQLREPWTGFTALRPCHRAICAVMCLFYDYKVDEGNILLNDLGGLNDSIKSRPGGMDQAIVDESGFMARIDAVLEGEAGESMREIADRHVWVESAFPAMLAVARKDRGVLAAASFLWLKGEDRLLWYILDSLGSEAIMVESAGAMAHFRAECQIKKPVHTPAVFQAAKSLLEDYLDMTPERIAARQAKEERGRTAGRKIDLILEEERKRNSEIYLDRKAETMQDMEEPEHTSWGDDEEERIRLEKIRGVI